MPSPTMKLPGVSERRISSQYMRIVREDREPSLGWTDAESATGRHTGWGGETYDLEVDL